MATPFSTNINTFTDYGAAQQDIERKRKMAELLQQQAMQPVEPVSQGAPISWTQGLAKMLQAYSGRKSQDVATEEQKTLANRARTEAMDWAQGMPQGSAQDLAAGMVDENGEAMPPALKTTQPSRQDMMAWALKGGMSGNPMAAQMAGPFMTQLMKQDEPYSLREGEKRFGPGGVPIAENPKVLPLHFQDTGSAIQGVDPRTGMPVGPTAQKTMTPGETATSSISAANHPFLPNGQPNPAYQEFQLEKARRGASNVITNMPPQERAFESKLGTEQADELVKGRTAADDAAQIIRTVHQGRDILKSGMVTGFGANAIVSIGQALKQAGVDFGTNDPVANAQAYTANMAGNVGKIIKQFGSGTGLSDADREYATKMAGGLITLDKAAIEKILDINERQARWVIERHNKRAEGIRTNIPLVVQPPPAYGTTQDGTPRAVRRYNPATGKIEGG